jgi:hypothetical protein
VIRSPHANSGARLLEPAQAEPRRCSFRRTVGASVPIGAD